MFVHRTTMSDLIIEPYNNKKLVVRIKDGTGGKHHPYHRGLSLIKARWNDQLDPPGWLVPIENEKLLEKYIASMDAQKEQFAHTKTHIKSRHKQSKYHRAKSDSEEESFSDLSPSDKERVANSPDPAHASFSDSESEEALRSPTPSPTRKRRTLKKLRGCERDLKSMQREIKSIVSYLQNSEKIDNNSKYGSTKAHRRRKR